MSINKILFCYSVILLTSLLNHLKKNNEILLNKVPSLKYPSLIQLNTHSFTIH